MEQFFPEHLPWLTENDQFFRGLEAGALLMLCHMGVPAIQAKIRWDNEDQVRVAAGNLGYDVEVTKRTQEWSFVNLLTKKAPAMTEGNDGDG
jgi:hypothetical protein